MQKGELNHQWKGCSASYRALHYRVITHRGSPQLCEECGTQDAARFDWANVSGDYHRIEDYVRLCRSCHCRRDGVIRNINNKFFRRASSLC